MPLPIHLRCSGSLVLTLICSVLITGCAVELDPFGRHYNGQYAMPAKPWACNKDQFDTPPELIRGNRPHFPVDDMLRGLKGEAKVRFEIDSGGKARMLSADSPKSKYFASHAAVAIADWKIKPAKKQGVPVPVDCAVIFRYE